MASRDEKLETLWEVALLPSCHTMRHQKRLEQIEAARAAGELTTAEYLSLKNEADQIRATQVSGFSASFGD
jgi:hypothetical protein